MILTNAQLYTISPTSTEDNAALRSWMIAQSNNVEQIAGGYFPRSSAFLFQPMVEGVEWTPSFGDPSPI